MLLKKAKNLWTQCQQQHNWGQNKSGQIFREKNGNKTYKWEIKTTQGMQTNLTKI